MTQPLPVSVKSVRARVFGRGFIFDQNKLDADKVRLSLLVTGEYSEKWLDTFIEEIFPLFPY